MYLQLITGELFYRPHCLFKHPLRLMLHLNYFKKALTFLAILGLSVSFQMPVKAQNVMTRQQLDQLSLQELYVLRREQIRQARIVVNNCESSTYIAPQTCNIIRLRYNNYFANLNNYIAQREVLGR
jgi:hypothetical protein